LRGSELGIPTALCLATRMLRKGGFEIVYKVVRGILFVRWIDVNGYFLGDAIKWSRSVSIEMRLSS
jgi:hypothetical protein